MYFLEPQNYIYNVVLQEEAVIFWLPNLYFVTTAYGKRDKRVPHTNTG